MIFWCFLSIVADPRCLELAATAPVCHTGGKPSTWFPPGGPVEQEASEESTSHTAKAEANRRLPPPPQHPNSLRQRAGLPPPGSHNQHRIPRLSSTLFLHPLLLLRLLASAPTSSSTSAAASSDVFFRLFFALLLNIQALTKLMFGQH